MNVDTLTRIRVLRTSQYRCGFEIAPGHRCGAPAALVAHPAPLSPAPALAVCKAHAVVARP